MKNMDFEAVIRQYGRLVYTNKGDSMWPLIREGKDLVVIGPAQGRLKKYDVPLYRRDSGQYVLHRVMKVLPDGYLICGDNRRHWESGIQDRHVIGVLTAVIRAGKEVPVTDWRYRIYVFLWCRLYAPRLPRILYDGVRRRVRRFRANHRQKG